MGSDHMLLTVKNKHRFLFQKKESLFVSLSSLNLGVEETGQNKISECFVYQFSILIYEPVFCGSRQKKLC